MKELNLKRENVLGIDVCDVTPEKGVALSLETMHGTELNTVFFLSVVSSIYCQETPRAAELINSLELVFPGDRHTELAAAQKALVGENEFGQFAEEYMNRLFTRLNREHREVFAVTVSLERLKSLADYMDKMYPDITFSGMVYDKEAEGAGEKLVNEINGHTPDALLLLLPPAAQLMLLGDYGTMMNAGLCICIESLSPMILEEIRPVPAWIRALHLESLYYWMHKEQKLQSRINGTRFKKRITEDALSEGGPDK